MRKKLSTGLVALAAALPILAVGLAPQPVAAQSLFESIFGGFGSKPAPRRSRPAPQRLNESARQNSFESPRPQPRRYSGRYKTICVRMCDGYFFPISNSTPRRQFYEAAQQCRSRCNGDARLFYLPSSAPSIAGARDLRGLRYRKMKTAFLYRKQQVNNCACRPKPWSATERLRHKSYEVAAENSTAGETSVAAVEPKKVESKNVITDGSIIGAAGLAPRPAKVTVAKPIAVQRAPLIVARPVVPQRNRTEPLSRRRRSGLGRTIGGLPRSRYRHNWTADTN